MVADFCAVRFTEDENLLGRTYWYLADFPVQEGDSVLAPVGSHDGLQRAVVERVVCAPSENAPYDVRLLKRLAAKAGARKLKADGIVCYELGGVKYDAKRYTRFRRVLISEERPQTLDELKEYGVTALVPAEGDVYGNILREKGCVLVYGRDAYRVGETLTKLVRDGDTELPAGTAAALARLLR